MVTLPNPDAATPRFMPGKVHEPFPCLPEFLVHAAIVTGPADEATGNATIRRLPPCQTPSSACAKRHFKHSMAEWHLLNGSGDEIATPRP
jgi:hypothetical protein